MKTKIFGTMLIFLIFIMCRRGGVIGQLQNNQIINNRQPLVTRNFLPIRISLSETINNISKYYHLQERTVVSIYTRLNYNHQTTAQRETDVDICTMADRDSDKLLKNLQLKLNEAKSRQKKQGNCSKPTTQPPTGKLSVCRCCKSKLLRKLGRLFPKFCPCVCIRKNKRKKSRKQLKMLTNKAPTSNQKSKQGKLSGNEAVVVPAVAPQARSFSVSSNMVVSTTKVMSAWEADVLKELNITDTRARATMEECLEKNEQTEIKTLNMCKTCRFIIQLPSNFSPQFVEHVTCGEPNNMSCFSDQGLCVKNVVATHIVILDDEGRIQDEDDLRLTACCSCEILPNKPFASFV